MTDPIPCLACSKYNHCSRVSEGSLYRVPTQLPKELGRAPSALKVQSLHAEASPPKHGPWTAESTGKESNWPTEYIRNCTAKCTLKTRITDTRCPGKFHNYRKVKEIQSSINYQISNSQQPSTADRPYFEHSVTEQSCHFFHCTD